ncbi:MAG: hypothetical protein B6244_09230 [Candidatus Cloacimonetes bacterium 4572_55]|nr:MAG: hypothetical protein B6244_09230 [Candidatus Cloacimonetes bacterium 4572_55]
MTFIGIVAQKIKERIISPLSDRDQVQTPDSSKYPFDEDGCSKKEFVRHCPRIDGISPNRFDWETLAIPLLTGVAGAVVAGMLVRKWQGTDSPRQVDASPANRSNSDEIGQQISPPSRLELEEEEIDERLESYILHELEELG